MACLALLGGHGAVIAAAGAARLREPSARRCRTLINSRRSTRRCYSSGKYDDDEDEPYDMTSLNEFERAALSQEWSLECRQVAGRVGGAGGEGGVLGSWGREEGWLHTRSLDSLIFCSSLLRRHASVECR
jgi:hypothetical protein